MLMLVIVLSGCCRKRGYRNDDSINLSGIPLHRLQTIDKPICKISTTINDTSNKPTYKDLVDCLLMYKNKLEQSNIDKEEIVNIINNGRHK